VARREWEERKVALAAVEHLLERRAARRRAEVARHEARELDDIASQRWLRAHGALAESSPAMSSDLPAGDGGVR
jgi:flagellar biosynthesis chaperone FliJ